MNHKSMSGSDLVFARYTTSSMESGYFDSSASPYALWTTLRNMSIVVREQTGGTLQPKADKIVVEPEQRS